MGLTAMSEPFKFRHLNRIVGAFILGSAAIVLAAVVAIGQATHWLGKHFDARVRFDRSNLGLLRTGLPVKIQGLEAGEVASARADGESTIVHLRLRDAVREQLRQDARAVLHTPIAGILGETFVEILPGSSEAPFSPEDDTMAQEPGDDLVVQARAAIIAIGGAAEQLRGLLAENRKEVTAAVTGVRRTADQTAALVEENRASLKSGLARIDSLAGRVDDLAVKMAPSLAAGAEKLPVALDQATAAGTSLQKAADAIGGAATAMGKAAASAQALVDDNRPAITAALADLQGVLRSTNALTTDLDRIAAQVASGKGSLGKLVMEDTAHDTAVKAIETLQKRMDELGPVIASISDLRLFIGVDGGYDTRSGSSTAGVHLRLEPRTWKFYEGGLSYRTARRDHPAEVEADTVVPVDFTLLLGWRFWEAEDKDHYSLSLAAGLVETRPALRVDIPLGTRRVVWETMARGKHNNRHEDDRRYEEGVVLVRSQLDVWLWQDHIALVAGGNDLAGLPGPWIGLRGELQDNDLKNITQVSALFK